MSLNSYLRSTFFLNLNSSLEKDMVSDFKFVFVVDDVVVDQSNF